jgi:phenylacetate-CoA ligase
MGASSLAMTLYHGSPLWTQNLLSSLRGYQLRRLRYGGIFLSVLESLAESQWFSAEEIAALQEERLRQTVRHAYQSVPYYHELFASLGLSPADIRSAADLAKLPILSKETVRRHFPQFISSAVPRRSIRFYRTSGSTGAPLPLACDAATVQTDWAHMWHTHRMFGVDYTARGAHFPGKTIVPADQKTPPFWRSNRLANQEIFSVFHIGPKTAASYLDELGRWMPEYWYGYPSAMALLCKHAEAIGRVCLPPPRAIFAGSERVYPRDRDTMMRVAQCRVMSGYGSQEYVCRILECDRGVFHLHPEFGIAEIVDEDGQPAVSGRLIATGFANRVMPLIRYDTGDLAQWADGTCVCGRQSPLVADILGRTHDCIVTPDGRTLGHVPLVHVLSCNVLEGQLYQPDRDTLVVRIVKQCSFTSKDEADILKSLRQQVGASMKLRCEYLDVLPRTAAGKLRTVVSDVR